MLGNFYKFGLFDYDERMIEIQLIDRLTQTFQYLINNMEYEYIEQDGETITRRGIQYASNYIPTGLYKNAELTFTAHWLKDKQPQRFDFNWLSVINVEYVLKDRLNILLENDKVHIRVRTVKTTIEQDTNGNEIAIKYQAELSCNSQTYVVQYVFAKSKMTKGRVRAKYNIINLY